MGGQRIRGTEWTTASSGGGFPGNVQISNNTTLRFNEGGASGMTCGNLTIDVGAALYADWGGGSNSAKLTVNGNINIGGNISLGLATGGDLWIGGNFTKTVGTFNCNSREVRFIGSGTQTYSSNATENINFLTNAKAAGTLNINSSIAIPNLGNSVTLTSANTVFVNGVTITMNDGTIWSSSSGNVTINGTLRNTGTTGASFTSSAANLIFSSTGLYDHNVTRSATTIGAIPTANWQSGSTCAITGLTNPTTGSWPTGTSGISFSNFIWNTPSLTTSPNMSANLTVLGSLTIQNTGSSEIRMASSSTRNIATVNYSQTGGTINLTDGTATSTINTTGIFLQTGGIIKSTGSSTTSSLTFNGSSTQLLTFSGTISGNVNYVFNNSAGFALMGSAAVPSGCSVTRTVGAFSGSGIISYNAIGTSLIYNNTSAFNSSDYEFPSANGPVNLTLNGGGITLHAARTLPATGILTLTNGVFSIGNFDLTVSNTVTGAVTGTYSASSMVSVGTGQLIRGVTGTNSYIFPVGETNNYTPALITFTTNSGIGTLGIRVVDGISPNMNTQTVPSDYLSRYWLTSATGISTYTYNAALTYLPADFVGTLESNLKVAAFMSTDWNGFVTTITSPTITATGITNLLANLTAGELCGRNSSVDYTWNGSNNSSWNISANWTPASVPTSIDDIIINVPGTNQLVITGAQAASNFTLNGKPVENAFIDSFNGCLRDECLNVHQFASLAEAHAIIEAWRMDYNHHRPHRSLRHLTLNEFVAQRLEQEIVEEALCSR